MDDERRFHLWMAAINATVNVFRMAIPAVTIVAIASFAAKVLLAYAGKHTDATVIIKLITSIQLDRWIAWAAGAMGVTYGVRQRHLRRKAIERTTKRPIELEQVMDPKRTSSQLTTLGTTRREDR